MRHHPAGVMWHPLREAHDPDMSGRSAGFDGPVPPPPRPIEYSDLDSGSWWLSMLFGAVLVAVGVWLLSNLYESVTVLAILVGISLVVGGVAEALTMGGRDGFGWAAWAGGAVVVAAGFVVLAWPDVTLKAVAIVAGLALLLIGLLRIASALQRHASSTDWPVQLAVGAFGVILGAIILAWPSATLMVLGFFLGLRAVFTGLLLVGTGWKQRQLAA